ncbi:MAG: PDDEXK nuclease domain-containing protein [Muribaculaceae bacterium]|nr:PDDEXK nuclease domain-containing protein [Muribaculaceae bacterium]
METIIVTHSESEYNEILRQAVAVVESSRANVARAIVGASNEMHWRIGQLLYESQLDSKRGDGVVKRLSVDLKARYPKMGMSVSNLWAMKKYYGRFRLSELKLQRSVGVLPWRHINQLMTKLKDDDQAIQYYADKTIEKGWNCDLLVNAIKMEMHKQCPEKNVSNNFVATLPTLQAAYANEVFKDSYCMGFLGVTEPLLELELERRLVEKIKQFLLELGQGFTYIGNQHVLSYNGKDYKVDMLFFHRGLRSLVAIDLKISEFKPEYVGKMNVYLSLLDKLEKGKDENPSIGIILCAEKDNVEVELALDGFTKPIGVAEYKLIVPQKELKQLISDEIKTFNKEIAEKSVKHLE